MKKFSKFIKSLSALTILSVLLLSPAYAAMNDYCITPPFIVAGVNPNLLLMIDNSASMFDLTYIDTVTAEPAYCYDQTYNFDLRYAGYFQDKNYYYAYEFAKGYFYEVATLPDSGTCDKYIPGTLCVNLNDDNTLVERFVAEGNYLNWLSASKFDIQKQILTGGKYTIVNETDGTNGLKQETRGCVGRRYIKEPITSQTYVVGGTNTGLGITFAIKGPDHPYSDTLLSPGGQTALEIYFGDYNAGLCDTAVKLIIAGAGKNEITTAIEACLNYSDKDTCSLDPTIPCKDDTDCDGDTGTGVCPPVVHDGICGLNNDGNCEITTFGVCTANNGDCRQEKPRICVGGGKDGASCNNDNDCKYSSCTVGRIGSVCTVNADCNLQTCTAGLIGNACVVDSECNTGVCTEPDSNDGKACTVNTDCDSGLSMCTSGQIGKTCTTSVECNTGYAGVCQKPVTQQIKSTFGQSMHECYQYWETGSFGGTDYLQLITNPSGCSQIYLEYMTCNGGERDEKQCYTLGVTADCPGGTCINGPEAIRQGSPALVCNAKFTGYCAGSNNDWTTTDWYKRIYASPDECITEKFKEFCTEAQVPPVTDPSDDPSTTEDFDNLPAIIGDMSIGSQLGDPLEYAGCTEKCVLKLNLKLDTAPSGLIQEFQNLIHFGAMRFNYYGTSSECPANMACTKICSPTSLTTCVVDDDCPTGDTCIDAANLDGARIIDFGPSDPAHMEGYILGRCSSTTTTTCTSPNHCPANESCVYSVGNHSSGFIKALDDIFASTWTPFSEGFYNAIGYFAQRIDTRLNNPDFITEGEDSDAREPIQYICQKNNILLVTDGMSTADLNPDVNSLVLSYNDGDGQTDSAASATCPEFAGSRNLDDLSWLAKHRNINDFTETPALTDPEINSKTITTHVVFNGAASTDPGECNPDTLLSETADNGGGTYQRAEDPAALRQALRESFLLIAGKAASGTAASVLASGEGEGANLVQAIFYPERTLGDTATELKWIGSMKNMWYFIDPYFGNSSIREDTIQDKTLVLDEDYIVNFYFNPDNNLTEAKLYKDADADGVKDPDPPATVFFEDVKSLWESGLRLWATLPANRTIYTTTNESTLIDFSSASAATLRTLLQSPSNAAATRLISYVRGTDYGNKFCSSTVTTSCAQDSDCPAGACSVTTTQPCHTYLDCPVSETCVDGETCIGYRNRTLTIGGSSGTWKLGDVINSTPRIASWVPLNAYNRTYEDRSYRAFTESNTYTDRGMVYVGANDGMLHAFNLGYLKLYNELEKKAQLCNSKSDCTTTNIGREEWAFIPKNALPYLQFAADPGYCHLYFADLIPYVFDASIGCADADYWSCEKYDINGDPDITQWRTVIIGGMRLGGACKDAASGLGVTVPAAGSGYSSYFALDITNPNNPQLLWEFSNADIPDPSGTGKLGFATTGPTVLRVNAPGDPDHSKNGRWLVVFGSGPTGPIETNTHQFKGFSDQNLKIFVLDLKTGALLKTFDTGIQNAFAGSFYKGSIDFDQDDTTKAGFYSDDAVYFGYVNAEDNPPVATTKWNKGGVMRLFTKESITPDPDWALSSVMSNIGPVTAAVAKLQNYKDGKVRLYFGTGRYFFRIADAIDDADDVRYLAGVKEPCYSLPDGLDTDCTSSVSWDDLDEAATAAGTDDEDGWFITLDSSAGILKAERSISAPIATRIGAIFFTTSKPSSDVCEFGGDSHLWGVQFDTGGTVPSSNMRGRALMQVSTGSIEEVLLKDAFTEREGRRTPAFSGLPPLEGTNPPEIPPPPTNKILQIRER